MLARLEPEEPSPTPETQRSPPTHWRAPCDLLWRVRYRVRSSAFPTV